MAIFDHGQVTSQLFEQTDNLRGLLLSQKIHLQFQLQSVLFKLGFSILSNEDHGRGYQCTQANNALQPGKWRRIQRPESEQVAH